MNKYELLEGYRDILTESYSQIFEYIGYDFGRGGILYFRVVIDGGKYTIMNFSNIWGLSGSQFSLELGRHWQHICKNASKFQQGKVKIKYAEKLSITKTQVTGRNYLEELFTKKELEKSNIKECKIVVNKLDIEREIAFLLKGMKAL